MDLLIVLMLIGWGFSALSKAAKKKQAENRPPSLSPSEMKRSGRQSKPIRPAEIDLPGQATMPIHWEGSTEGPITIPEPDPALKKYFGSTLGSMEGTMQPTHYETYAPPQEKHQAAAAKAQPVTIPGLDLTIDGDTLVKGVIFSEILTRKAGRRTR